MDKYQEIELLIFNLNGKIFGVDIEQVERMIDAVDLRAPDKNTFSHKHLLVYEDREIPVMELSQEIRLERDIDYQQPKVLLVKKKNSYIGFLIDNPSDIVSVSIDDINSLPKLVEISKSVNLIWGVAKVKEQLVILIDLLKYTPN